jgi:nucleoredoxin
MDHWTAHFGDQLLTKEGLKPTSQVLAGKKIIGIYFSAHWCPPCRQFTPVLASTYEDMVEEHDDLEVIFVSSDRDAASFEEYYASMPFKALPFTNRAKKAEISARYDVNGIPTLIFLNGQGEVITTDGRSIISTAQGDVDSIYAELS